MNFDVPPGDPRSFKAASLGVKRLANVLAAVVLVVGSICAFTAIPSVPQAIPMAVIPASIAFWSTIRLIDWVIRGFRKG